MRSLGRKFGILLIATGILFTCGPLAFGQEFPNKPVTLVIPYPAGGSTDLTGRALANASCHLGRALRLHVHRQ